MMSEYKLARTSTNYYELIKVSKNYLAQALPIESYDPLHHFPSF